MTTVQTALVGRGPQITRLPSQVTKLIVPDPPKSLLARLWSDFRAALPVGAAGIVTWFLVDVLPSILRGTSPAQALFKAVTCLIAVGAALAVHLVYTRYFQ